MITETSWHVFTFRWTRYLWRLACGETQDETHEQSAYRTGASKGDLRFRNWPTSFEPSLKSVRRTTILHPKITRVDACATSSSLEHLRESLFQKSESGSPRWIQEAQKAVPEDAQIREELQAVGKIVFVSHNSIQNVFETVGQMSSEQLKLLLIVDPLFLNKILHLQLQFSSEVSGCSHKVFLK